MEVKEMDIAAKSRFLSDYLDGHPHLHACFDYSATDKERFKKRKQELRKRSFPREALVEHLQITHKDLPYKNPVESNIEKLKDPTSVVVVGGQQAGLLTGPLYTVYKAMSVIFLAKSQESELQVPVVPVFWIAGEDHDLEEVRFVYTQKDETWKKIGIDMTDTYQSLSSTPLPKDKLHTWLNQVFKTLPETNHTEHLIATIKNFAKRSSTFVNFFSLVMNWLFKEEGLILLDSDHPGLRAIETDYFMMLVNRVEDLQSAQQKGEQTFSELGYGEPISTDQENAHLFYTYNDERKRLDYKDGAFYIKNSEIRFTKRELVDLVSEYPERFSNNVVTRPLMQEFILPVLSFVAGPGELAYWGTLKPVFHAFHTSMPPLTPRLQMTFVPRSMQKWVEENHYTYDQLLSGEVRDLKKKWLKEVENHPIDEVVADVTTSFKEAHLSVQQLSKKIDETLYRLSKKNEEIILEQLNFMKKKMVHSIEGKHQLALSKFDEAENWLTPLNRPQERVIHPIVLLNLAGCDAIDRIMEQKMSLNTHHKLILL
ncbi:bacillithiol biosynthesis cysteine-adding enzyme BshC [Alkalihalophilus lindianensis]|uniref:Putative cysteine ligase BshC n=1 Tax=Alkalihalophilus lindianensis TaxID=1630542 RepID=A0ABU3XBR5_9BACI|nr:bacillithiol biosynthesis cysteine-adding enzyme BshC [Alkalihalophilus lindianensis]MDV2685325.1 bacillithiol biosynthesis cysteine-adding enzyme BshC [Alkalihalophilus lindianensis]